MTLLPEENHDTYFEEIDVPDLARSLIRGLGPEHLARFSHDPFGAFFDAVRAEAGGDLTPDCYHPL